MSFHKNNLVFQKKKKQCSCAVDLPLGQGNPLGYPDLVYTQSLKLVHVVPIFLYTDSQSHMYYANGTSQVHVFNPHQVSLKNRKGRRHKLLVLIGSFNYVSTKFLLGNFIVYMYYCKSGYLHLWLSKKKYTFSKVSHYAWVLNTQMSDFHTKGLSFLPCARGYFTWF